MRNERMYAELIELLTTDSASGKETAIAALLRPKMEALGFKVDQDNAGETINGECGNLICVREGELDGALLLSSHMDRVPNGYGIKPVERDGILYSDGTTILAADDISGVCVILEGLRRVLATGRPLPRIEVVFSIGEEIGLYGAKALDMNRLQARMGYVFDSPGGIGRFVNGAPGAYDLKVDLTGRPAHAGNEPEAGIDAAKILCDILSSLRQGRLDPVSTSNFPIISTGNKATNVVCAHSHFEGEARSRDAQRLEDYVAYFEEHCKTIAAEKGAGIEIKKTFNYPPFYVPEDNLLLVLARKASEQLSLNYRAEVGGGGMDGNIYSGRGIPCVGVATGYSKNHTTSEQLIMEDFYRSGELAESLILLFADTCPAKAE